MKLFLVLLCIACCFCASLHVNGFALRTTTTSQPLSSSFSILRESSSLVRRAARSNGSSMIETAASTVIPRSDAPTTLDADDDNEDNEMLPKKVLPLEYVRTPSSPINDLDKKDSSNPTAESRSSFSSLSDSLDVADNPNQQQQQLIVTMALLWSIAVVSALDRVAMSVALVPMANEFGFSDTIKGSISSFFSIGYGLAILPAGVGLSTLSARTVMAWGIGLWSMATLATPLAAEYWWSVSSSSSIGMVMDSDLATTSATTATASTLLVQYAMLPLLLVRACVGVGESIVIPSTQRLLAVWTSPGQKGLAIAFVFFGFQVGNVAAYCLSPMVMDVLGGWRGLFYTYGLVGMLLLVPWLLFSQDAPTSTTTNKSLSSTTMRVTHTLPAATNTKEAYPAVPAKPFQTPMNDALEVFQSAPWKDFAQSKGTWGMLLAHAAKNWGLYNSLAWTPTFYAEQYGLNVRDSAFLSILPAVAGASCGLLAGGLADTMVRRMDPVTVQSKTNLRKAFQAVGLLGPGVALGSLALNIPEEAWVAQVFLTIAVGLQSFNAGGFESGNQDKAGPQWAGMLYSVTSLPAVMFGTFGVWFTGRLLDASHQDWSSVFAINSGINVLGALAFLLLFDSKREFD